MAPVAELEAGLEAMLRAKPPGAPRETMEALTLLCFNNVQDESVLFQKLYTHFKKAPATHKLGVVYVIDTVMRKWLAQAKIAGFPIDDTALDGTYAAGAHRVTELMPRIMDELLRSAPQDQKAKISRLLGIWEGGHTFPIEMIESWRKKFQAAFEPTQSTTPVGSPPPSAYAVLGYPYNKATQPPASTVPTDSRLQSLLKDIEVMGAQQKAAAPTQNNPVSAQPFTQPQNGPYVQNGTLAAQTPTITPELAKVLESIKAAQSLQPAPPTTQYQAPFAMPPFTQPAGMPIPAPQFPYAPPQSSFQPQAPAGVPFPGATSQQPNSSFDLLRNLVQGGLSQAKIQEIVSSLSNQNGTASAAPVAPVSGTPSTSYYAPGQAWGSSAQSNDNYGRDPQSHRYNDNTRSPKGYHGRSRSRSPGRRWDSRPSSRGGRDNGNGNGYGRSSPDRGRHDDEDGRRGGDYRQRSPIGHNEHGRSPRPNPNDKWVEYDRSLPRGNIKVLSRTLFVGGVQSLTEQQLRDIFSQYGHVQTCILNREKRHAFVKMISRQDAVRAKEAMERANGEPQALRTRWGVGFGPRDCSDYQTGVSIIPIGKLTDADRKWLLTAEYGGSGGRPIEGGLVVEEPDIEIGAGVSSKAISRRMQTDKSGNHGPRSTRGGRDDERDDHSNRWRRSRDRRDDNQASTSGVNAQPLTEPFPYNIATLPNGMPSYPPGFVFPAPNGGQ
ncbi:Rpb7-binding protein seb1 [Colletotrichum chlorophyti]|uniref:Rpb7-binding protein seb1 n=1 Tax=Colletotrichum chlorophyti TaxID=708187 RepID=A0A1Q8RPD3_9PEZI|nr:Rpb7-binding protein seb1 [Colletotrichum chlorophyti]